MQLASSVTTAVLLVPLLAPAEPAWGAPLETAARAFARQEFAEVLRQLPPSPAEAEVNLLRGRALLLLGQHAKAEQALRGLFSQLPDLRDLALFLHAESLLGQGRREEAASQYRAAARSKGSRFVYRAWRRRTEALLAAEKWGAAAEELRHLLRIRASSSLRPEWELELALCREKLGQKRQAATALREIWLQWPMNRAADRARKELDRLLAESRLRLPPLSLQRQLGRIRLLRREKHYQRCLDELQELRARLKGHEAARVDMETVTTLIRANRPAEALTALQKFPPESAVLPGWQRRSLLARCLAATGKVKEASELLLEKSYRETGPLKSHQRAEVSRAATLLAEHGHYKEALKLRQRLASLTRKPSPETIRELAWLSYRAGRQVEAVGLLRSWAKQARHEEDFAWYWQARAEARGGQPEKAQALYQALVEKYGSSYYGLLARSRLVEGGKLELGSGQCEAAPAVAPGSRQAEVMGRLEALLPRYAALLPELRRAHILWRLGMINDGRRELRLLAIRLAWVAAGGRPREWIQRPSVERLWRGGPLEARRWNKQDRLLAAEGPALRHRVAELLRVAGISYFGWRLGAPDPDPERRRNPRAYPELVRTAAARFKLDPNLLWAIMRTESHYRLDVISRVGATGLMQIMPHTARRIAAAMELNDFEQEQLFEPETNLSMAAWYLRALSDKFHGQIPLIAAGYNGGPHHVARWLSMRGSRCEMDEFVEEIPFSESRRYAKKILRLMALYERLYCAKNDRVQSNQLDPSFAPQPNF